MSILRRQILYPGKTDIGKLDPETKLIYHFKTAVIQNAGSESKVIDDSRSMAKGEPVETIYGKQFKLPIWESCLASMAKGEVCKLTVRDDATTHYICLNYVITSKCFRQYYKVKPTVCHDHNPAASTHNCSMSLRDSPYKDLNELIQRPPEIFEFTFELVDVLPPNSYAKDVWQMDDQEKLSAVPKFREDGNRNYTECNYDKAVSSYMKGLDIIESLMLKEKPRDKEWNKLDNMKIPFFLNLAQVKLTQGEYYECIKFCDEVLKRDIGNIKALFRRAKAHTAVWNLDDARNDLGKCMEIDSSTSKMVMKCLHELKAREELKNKEDRERFGKIFSQ